MPAIRCSSFFGFHSLTGASRLAKMKENIPDRLRRDLVSDTWGKYDCKPAVLKSAFYCRSKYPQTVRHLFTVFVGLLPGCEVDEQWVMGYHASIHIHRAIACTGSYDRQAPFAWCGRRIPALFWWCSFLCRPNPPELRLPNLCIWRSWSALETLSDIEYDLAVADRIFRGGNEWLLGTQREMRGLGLRENFVAN